MFSILTLFLKKQTRLILIITLLIVISLCLVSYSIYTNSIKRYNDVVNSLNKIVSYYFAEEEKRVNRLADKIKNEHIKLSNTLSQHPENSEDIISKFQKMLIQESGSKADIALISRDLIVASTTLLEEKNLDLKQFEDARIVAEEVLSKNDDNYVNITFPVYTPATNTFRIYTFSYIKNLDIFLQIGIDTEFLKFSPLIEINDKNLKASMYYSGGNKVLDTFDLVNKSNTTLPEAVRKFIISPEREFILDSFMLRKYFFKISDFNYMENVLGSIIVEISLNKKEIYFTILTLLLVELVFLIIIYITFVGNIISYKKSFFIPFRKILTSIKRGQPIEKYKKLKIKELLILSKNYNSIINSLHHKNREFERAIIEIKNLRDLLPVCSHCKKIRDENGNWHKLESYLSEKHQLDFTHSLCPDCIRALYPKYADEILKNLK